MIVTITDLKESGYRWVLEAGPDNCFLESGRASDLVSCAVAVQAAQADLGTCLRHYIDAESNTPGNVLTHPRFNG